MRTASLLLLATLAACGSSTDTAATRYNFAVIDGANQTATAASFAPLGKPITTELRRDPQGKFASNILDFLKPSIAYAQGIQLSGTPVANALVCGRVAPAGEPQVVPLCAFTLADGQAPNRIEVGTLAGTYTILFTAQVPSQEPVVDSTTVTVEAGPMASHVFLPGHGFQCWTLFPALDVTDQYGNAVSYRFVTKGSFAHVAGDVLGTEAARTLVPDSGTDPAKQEFQSVDVEVASGVIASGKLTTPSFPAQSCVSINF